jgi:hypothetical protein
MVVVIGTPLPVPHAVGGGHEDERTRTRAEGSLAIALTGKAVRVREERGSKWLPRNR